MPTKRIYPQEPLDFYRDKDRIHTLFYDSSIVYCYDIENNKPIETKHSKANDNNYLKN